MRAIEAILANHWAILPDCLEKISNIAMRNHGGLEAVQKEMGKKLEYTRTVTRRGRTAIIPIEGVIFPKANLMSAYSGGTSLDILSSDLHKAVDDETIDNIILDIDSPGGAVSGISEMADMIHAAAQKKPIISYVSGMCASAAYWLASGTTEIIANSTSMLGSIGVVGSVSKQVEPDQDGRMNFDIVSSNAPDKRPDLNTEDGISTVRRRLDALEVEFIGQIAGFRNKSSDFVRENFGKGDVMIAAEAVKVGMADKIGNFEEVISDLNSSTQTGGSPMASNNTAAAAAAAEVKAPLTKDALKTEYADIYSAVSKEGYEDGIKAGITAERERLAAIDDIAVAGFEDLVKNAKANGTSAADLAISMAKANKQIGESNLSSLIKQTIAQPDIKPSADNSTIPAAVDHTLSPEEKMKATWNNDSELRAEFNDRFDDYKAFEKANAAGQVKGIA